MRGALEGLGHMPVVLGVYAIEKRLVRSGKATRRKAMQGFEHRGPASGAGSDVRLPRADA